MGATNTDLHLHPTYKPTQCNVPGCTYALPSPGVSNDLFLISFLMGFLFSSFHFLSFFVFPKSTETGTKKKERNHFLCSQHKSVAHMSYSCFFIQTIFVHYQFIISQWRPGHGHVINLNWAYFSLRFSDVSFTAPHRVNFLPFPFSIFQSTHYSSYNAPCMQKQQKRQHKASQPSAFPPVISD